MKGTNAFERSVKEVMQHYEVPYNSADWVHLERAMSSNKGRRWSSNTGLLALLITGMLGLTIGTVLLVQNSNAPAPQRVEALMVAAGTEDASPKATAPKEHAGTASTIIVDEHVPGEEADISSDDHEAPLIKEIEATDKQASGRKGSAVAVSHGPPTDTDDAPDSKSTGSSSGALSFMPSVSEGCPGTTIEFHVQDLPEDGIFLWNFGDGSFSNKPNPSHTFSKPGKFEVMLSHSSTSGGNIMSKPSSDLILIHEAPQAAFNLRKQEYEGLIPSVHFENRSMGTGNTYHWDFGDGQTTTVAHPDHVFKRKGEYRVELTVTNSRGCMDKSDRILRIDRDYNLEAAAAFSPNSDGVNDTFIPEALRTLGLRFHLTVHDPVSGEVLFETNDAERPWNGRVQNKGEKCNIGEYVWVVEMKDGERFGGSYTGKVKLER